MATAYVNSGAGGAATGADWTNAYLTLGAAVTAGADIIKVHNAHSEALAADTTYTFTVDTRIICVNKDSSDALSTGAIIGNQVTNWAISFAGAFELYIYGLVLKNGSSTSSSKGVSANGSDGSHYELESCTFDCRGNTGSRIGFGSGGSTGNSYTKLKNCTARFNNAAHGFSFAGAMDVEGLTVDSGGTAPTSLILGNSPNLVATLVACDLSFVSGTLVSNFAGNGNSSIAFVNCKFNASVTIKAAAGTVLNKGQTTVTAIDCASGDTHYSLYHGDAFGETTAVTDYYYTSGGASINSSFAWKIVTTANCSFWNPYVSPWFSKAHTGTSAVTLSIEGLRLSTTVIQDDEVWGEFSYKGTSGQSIATLVNDRQDAGARANGTAGSNQTSSAATSDWTNGTGSHSTFKLATGSTVTPAEIGVLRGRVVVGEPSLTVYIDPQVRAA